MSNQKQFYHHRSENPGTSPAFCYSWDREGLRSALLLSEQATADYSYCGTIFSVTGGFFSLLFSAHCKLLSRDNLQAGFADIAEKRRQKVKARPSFLE